MIGPNDLPSQPTPPADAAELIVTRVQRRGAGIAGYWVWNASRFAGSSWAPRWEWVDDDRPYLLAD